MARGFQIPMTGFLSALLLAACSTSPNGSTPAATPSPSVTATSTPAAAAMPAPASVATTTAMAGSGDPKEGKKLFTSKGCNGCHTLGKGKSAGPDLKGVVARREGAWLRSWLKDSPAMAKTDPIAIQMVAEHKGMIMPKMGLTDDQVESIIAYLAGA